MVGMNSNVDIGAHLRAAAEARGMEVCFLSSDDAHASSRLVRALGHRVFGGYPLRGRRFHHTLLQSFDTFHPRYLLTTGKAPVFSETLAVARQMGIRSLNFSTDDPWNPKYAARWFFRALRDYDVVATPRGATMGDFCSINVRKVTHVLFGFSQEAHRCAADVHESLADGDIFFAGGCDADRVPFFEAVVAARLRPLLYGGYWDRQRSLRPFHRGFASLSDMAVLHARTPVSVCLVRRANRDTHVMRTFEAAAMGACLVMEDTSDHRQLFGPDGESVVYFTDPESLVAACRRVLADAGMRQRLRQAARRKILEGGHTYADRLDQMLAAASDS
jgi:spore maturation protein CgeB